MKVELFAICFMVFMSFSAKVTKKMRGAENRERELLDMGINGSAEQLLDASDSTAIDNASSRMASLVDRVNRLKTKLQRELQTTVSYLRYHFNQRDVFDKRVMMRHLSSIKAGEAIHERERKLIDQPMLKDYGKIEADIKSEDFESIKAPPPAEEDDNEEKK